VKGDDVAAGVGEQLGRLGDAWHEVEQRHVMLPHHPQPGHVRIHALWRVAVELRLGQTVHGRDDQTDTGSLGCEIGDHHAPPRENSGKLLAIGPVVDARLCRPGICCITRNDSRRERRAWFPA
jgi:hypothetical protein